MNLYVGNLSASVNEAEIHLLFEGQGLGKILFMRAADPNKPGSRGYAIIDLEDGIQAHIAISALNGKKLKGLPLVLRPINDKTWSHMHARHQWQSMQARYAS
ncbi:MAG: RNA-binding protein [Gammaproteobacteria bacterium]|nr:RNA-binding protein [Gammaproteobacteria bacterium]